MRGAGAGPSAKAEHTRPEARRDHDHLGALNRLHSWLDEGLTLEIQGPEAGYVSKLRMSRPLKLTQYGTESALQLLLDEAEFESLVDEWRITFRS